MEEAQKGCDLEGSQDKKFAEALAKKVGEQLGMLETQVDTAQGSVHFAYDPAHTSKEDILYAAERMQPSLTPLLGKCSFRLGGHACEACAYALERKMEQDTRVHRASASYLGGVLSVMYDGELISQGEIADRARMLGVRVKPLEDALAEEESRALRQFPTLGSKIGSWFQDDKLEILLVAIALVTLIGGRVAEKINPLSWTSSALYLVSYISGGYSGVLGGWQALREWIIDIDLLMILAALGAAYVGAPFEGSLLLFLFSFSNALQALAINRTRRAIHALAKIKPQQAHVIRGPHTETVPIESVAVGEKILIRPGESIPLDGEVLEGESTVDQSLVTGESMPVNKEVGEKVFAGTLNQLGSLTVRVLQVAQHSTISKLIQLVQEAQSEKAKTQRFLEQAEQYYATGVIILTVALMGLLPLLTHLNVQESIYLAITVMVVASPCAIVISTPASILSAIGNGARRGLLFKGGAHLERAASIRVVALDKTGTLTQGRPQVTDIILLKKAHGISSEDELLALAASVEIKSEHPLAKAIVAQAKQRNLKLQILESFQSISGKGAWGVTGGKKILIGSPVWFSQFESTESQFWKEKIQELEKGGKTSILIGLLNLQETQVEMLGIIALADSLRPEAASVVRSLKKLGIRRVVMLTGDSKRVARAVAAQAGVDEYYADLMPADKVRLIHALAEGESVAMVGDGINDAPALAASSVGIAMGAAGSEVALQSADIILMANDLQKIPYALALSQKTRQIMIQNLVFATCIILLMVGATIAYPFTGWRVPLPLAVVAHEGGTVLVCLNGLRLLAFQYR